MLIKQKNLLLPKSLAHVGFDWIANSAASKNKSSVQPKFNGPEVLTSVKLYGEKFSKASNIVF